MKLSSLLSLRETLLQQARLANLAFAYASLAGFAARVARSGLRGEVVLRSAAPEMERYGASLTALENHQSVIEEHFTDEDLSDLADVIAFLTGGQQIEATFRIEELASRFLKPLREELTRIGVALDEESQPGEPPTKTPGDDPRECPRIDGRG
jgi:hypothetical protein